MAELKKTDSFLYGLVHSDLDTFLLNRYEELISQLYELFESRKNEKGNAEVFDMFTNSLKSKNADSKRIIKSLDLFVKNETIPANQISLNQIKKNNLESIVEKTECLINDLTIIRNQIEIGKPTKNTKIPTTYNWLSNPEKELPELYNNMKGKFITETDFESFRAIFTGQPVQSINNKLIWLDDKTLLAYFLSSITELKKISKKAFFAKAKYCFENIEELKQSKLNYKTFNSKSNYKPKDYHLIDDLLKGL